VLGGRAPEDAPGRGHEAVGKVSFKGTERRKAIRTAALRREAACRSSAKTRQLRFIYPTCALSDCLAIALTSSCKAAHSPSRAENPEVPGCASAGRSLFAFRLLARLLPQSAGRAGTAHVTKGAFRRSAAPRRGLAAIKSAFLWSHFGGSATIVPASDYYRRARAVAERRASLDALHPDVGALGSQQLRVRYSSLYSDPVACMRIIAARKRIVPAPTRVGNGR
jgi:hypothetical protein